MDEKDKKDAAGKLLDRIYTTLDRDKNASTTIQGWCFAVWTASIGFVMESILLHKPLTPPQVLMLYSLPFPAILGFWFLDGLKNSFILIHRKKTIRVFY